MVFECNTMLKVRENGWTRVCGVQRVGGWELEKVGNCKVICKSIIVLSKDFQ